MEPSFHGQLSDKPVAIVIGEIADQKLAGLLRLRRDGSEKAIFFEAGAPAFASSNAPDEQLEHRLLHGGLVAAELIEEAKRRNLTPHELGWNLVELEALSQHALEQAIRQLAADIVLSVFEWEHGDYVFYENLDHGLGPRIEWTPGEAVLAAARRAANIESIVSVIAPDEARVVQVRPDPLSIAGSATLNSHEAFVLASIPGPTRISEIATMTGLPDSEARSAACVLLVLGLLQRDGETQSHLESLQQPDQALRDTIDALLPPGDEEDIYSETSVEWVLAMVSTKRNAFASADFYGILGVERIAPANKIAEAYSAATGAIDSFRSHWPDHVELAEGLDALSAKVEEAYATLSDPELRSAYDRSFVPASKRRHHKKSKPARSAAKPVAPPRRKPIPIPETPTALPAPPPSHVRAASPAPPRRDPSDPVVMAEEHYLRGKRRFDRSDFHAALHLFQEALKLDPSQARFHYQIGITLLILAQARHARHSHTDDVGCHVNCSLGGGLARNPRIRHEAERHMLKAAELDRTSPEIRLGLAKLYQESGMEKKAGHYFMETLMLDSGNPVAQRELGMLQKAAHKRQQSTKRSDRE
jgi:tetratricopeptide (TPR) repeat protein